jgi:hypothetical protein
LTKAPISDKIQKINDRSILNFMRRLFAILSLGFFVCHWLALGIPSADLDEDGKIDLQDAITAIRGLQSISEIGPMTSGGEALKIHLGQAVKVIKTIAGEETQVQKPEKGTLSTTSLCLAVQPSFQLAHHETGRVIKKLNPIHYQSIDPEKTTPPPKPFC